MKAMKPAMMDDAIMMIIMVTDMVMVGLAMVMVEMDLEPRKAVNMAGKKKRKIKNVTIAVKLTHLLHIKCGHCLWTCSADIHNEHTLV
jgi:hypothetical protein